MALTLEQAILYGSFGRRLERARQAAGLSLTELALRVGCNRATLAGLEDGHGPVPLCLAVGLCRALGLDLADMVRPSKARARWEALARGERHG